VRYPQPPRQQGLFGALPPSDADLVQPHAVAEWLRELAAKLPRSLRMGTSSWTFAGWRGIVYADRAREKALSKHGLQAYAQHPLLRTVGIDRTFYAPILTEDFARYAAAVPGDFRFLVKAWGELLTPFSPVRGRRARKPNPLYLESSVALSRVLEPAIRGLDKKLGAILFQFSPQGTEVTQSPMLFAQRLQTFLRALPQGPVYAVELRDPELLTPHYVAALDDCGAQHCYAVHSRMPSIEAQRLIAPLRGPVIARWMLHPGASYDEAKERYEPFSQLKDPDPSSRAALAALIREASSRELPVTLVVNNKAEGSAPLSVIELAKTLVAAQ
jgi:uncharacterized protein YecE (DUF72 family)